MATPAMPKTDKIEASDIPRETWIDRVVPDRARPYLRLARIDRPIGIWLLMFPCWWSAALATDGWPDVRLLALFALGAAVMRGAGCTLNDIVDRDFDARVARTAQRPVASGAISVASALLFMIGLSLLGLAILLQFNWLSVAVGAASLLLVALYPFAKRVTHWPQFVLGLTFNWGALLGWTAVRGDLGGPAVVLYAAGLLWTLGYDTIYAHQDKEDDIIVGVKSSALKLGVRTKPFLALFYGGAILLIGLAGAMVELSWPFFLGLGIAGGHFIRQVARLRTDDPRNCLAIFKSNAVTAAVIFLSIVFGQVVP